MVERITSHQNPRIKLALGLKLKRKRQKESLFLVEGFREVIRAVASSWKIKTLFVCETFFVSDEQAPFLEKAAREKNVELVRVAPHVFEKLSYRDSPDGLIGIFEEKSCSLEEIDIQAKSALLLVIEAVEKPGNLGSILRSADAAGVDGVIVCDLKVDLFSPNVVRASLGTFFSVPVVVCEMDDLLRWLKEKNIELVATSPDAKDIYTKVDLKSGIALAMGSEKDGLSEKLLKCADKKVAIPMKGIADSLNVAAATTLVLFEAVRQREC